MTHPSFLDDFAEISAIGATPAGGVERQAATGEHGAATRWFLDRCRQQGFQTRIDAVGNAYALATWVPDSPYVLVGSHLDSQPRAGRYDGAYGVLAALHAARRVDQLVERGAIHPRFNIAVVSWFNEEGSRFKPSMMGSGVYAGMRHRDVVLETVDGDGVTVRRALAEAGLDGGEDAPPAVGYAEIHIEQGRRLDAAGADIGLVTRNWCVRKYHLQITGEQSHTGATLFSDRRDALLAASQVIVSAREIVARYDEREALCAVGELNVWPNVAGVIAREAELYLDVRSAEPALLDVLHEQIAAMLVRVSQTFGVEIGVRSQDPRSTVTFGREGIEHARAVAEAQGYTCLELPTMAGHDAVNLTRIVPTTMLFIPSLHGISHNEREESTAEALERGVTVLAGVISGMVQARGGVSEEKVFTPSQLVSEPALS